MNNYQYLFLLYLLFSPFIGFSQVGAQFAHELGKEWLKLESSAGLSDKGEWEPIGGDGCGGVSLVPSSRIVDYVSKIKGLLLSFKVFDHHSLRGQNLYLLLKQLVLYQ